jgi:hypothetical protein
VSSGFVTTLALIVVALLAARLVLPGLPLRCSVTLTRREAAATVVGIVLLVYHCAAMFFPRTTGHIPGTDGIAHDIRTLGLVSQIWYVVPALLLVIGLHKVPRVALRVVILALAAVGVTMYDDGPLDTHLTAIAIAVVVLATCLATLVRPPRLGR